MLPNKSAKIRSNCVTTYSGPSINIMDLGLGFEWQTEVQSETSQEATPHSSWMFALGQYHRLQ